jgi:hypothetical protein
MRWETITRSAISEHERHSNYTNYYAYTKPYKVRKPEDLRSVCWDTFAPKSKSRTNPIIDITNVRPPVVSRYPKMIWTPLKSSFVVEPPVR